MGCILEFHESLVRCEFNGEGYNQRILVDMMLKYSEFNPVELAKALDISEDQLKEILDGQYWLVDAQAKDLSQLFLIFFGRLFFTKVSIIRNYVD